MDWLAEGVPLCLLIDLLGDSGPDSRSILVSEPETATWLTSTRSAA
jgi:hypothetical protein